VFLDGSTYQATAFLWIPSEQDAPPAEAAEPEEEPEEEPEGMGLLGGLLGDAGSDFAELSMGSFYEDGSMLIVAEAGSGATLYDQGGPKPAADLAQAVDAARAAAEARGDDPVYTVAFFPGATWTTQQLVSACSSVQSLPPTEDGSTVGCALLADFDASQIQRQPPRDIPEGGIGRIGSLEDLVQPGTLDKEQISDVIRGNMTGIGWCYNKALLSDPSLSGELKVKMVISQTGSVSQATVSTSTLGDRAVEECITERILLLQFPAPQGGGTVTVMYPFIFGAN
jgi:hypothetical protein